MITPRGVGLTSLFFDDRTLATETPRASNLSLFVASPAHKRRLSGYRVYDGSRLIQEEITNKGKVRRGRYLRGDLLIEIENLGPNDELSRVNIEDVNGRAVARYTTERARGAGFMGIYELLDVHGKTLIEIGYEDGRVIDAQVLLAPGDKTETADGGRFSYEVREGQPRLEFESVHLIIDSLRIPHFPFVTQPLYGFIELFQGRFTGELFMTTGKQDGLTIQSHYLLGLPHGAMTVFLNGEASTTYFENGWPNLSLLH